MAVRAISMFSIFQKSAAAGRRYARANSLTA
jgi:hypothetical protein